MKYIAVPLVEESIIQFYERCAKSIGENADGNFDCTRINVSNERMEYIESYYMANGMDAPSFAMLWCCIGPKAIDKLVGEVVRIADGFVS